MENVRMNYSKPTTNMQNFNYYDIDFKILNECIYVPICFFLAQMFWNSNVLIPKRLYALYIQVAYYAIIYASHLENEAAAKRILAMPTTDESEEIATAASPEDNVFNITSDNADFEGPTAIVVKNLLLHVGVSVIFCLNKLMRKNLALCFFLNFTFIFPSVITLVYAHVDASRLIYASKFVAFWQAQILSFTIYYSRFMSETYNELRGFGLALSYEAICVAYSVLRVSVIALKLLLSALKYRWGMLETKPPFDDYRSFFSVLFEHTTTTLAIAYLSILVMLVLRGLDCLIQDCRRNARRVDGKEVRWMGLWFYFTIPIYFGAMVRQNCECVSSIGYMFLFYFIGYISRFFVVILINKSLKTNRRSLRLHCIYLLNFAAVAATLFGSLYYLWHNYDLSDKKYLAIFLVIVKVLGQVLMTLVIYCLSSTSRDFSFMFTIEYVYRGFFIFTLTLISLDILIRKSSNILEFSLLMLYSILDPIFIPDLRLQVVAVDILYMESTHAIDN